jgi:hypothetical protein
MNPIISVYPDNSGENIDNSNKMEAKHPDNDWFSRCDPISVPHPNKWPNQSEVDKNMFRQMNILLSQEVQVLSNSS